MLNLFEIRGQNPLHHLVRRLSLGGFSIARFWDGEGFSGVARGRAFENALYKFCERSDLRLSEITGSRTLRDIRSASGLRHESDGVIAAPELTIHIETKHLSSPVSKNDLMVFNQKGLDFLLAGDRQLCQRPLYRVFLSGSQLSEEARRFALIWGIVTVEPDRLPLPLLHWLAGSSLSLQTRDIQADRIWVEIPRFVVPLQERLRRIPTCLDGYGQLFNLKAIDFMLNTLQDQQGDKCWAALDCLDPTWLERVYESITVRRTEQNRSEQVALGDHPVAP